ncbi:reverse transcriptase family protein [Idiomarina loihiensis]|uniref:reverse transcriptase family protein n=1 Tax=Idiomarina loihiensis TaxID=135577 RepID=UPI00384C7DAA
MDKPYYKNKPIGSIESLAETLRINKRLLVGLSRKIEDSYHPFDVKTNSGKIRRVYEPKNKLKIIQKRINREIFESVKFPSYLKGAIRDTDDPRDYIINAKEHGRSETLISLDITSFYESITEDKVTDILKYLLKFPSDVSELLTRLTVLDGKVPQGACTSSYIANLVFFNSEYKLVSRFRRKGIRYTRLLDDITLSSEKDLSTEEVESAIEGVVGLFSKYGLKNNSSKLRVEKRNFRNHNYRVTGLWVGNKNPALSKKERAYIRQLVFETEKLFKKDRTSSEYHKLWNMTSGKVAKMARLQHSQSKDYRKRLSVILPELGEDDVEKLVYNVKRFVGRLQSGKNIPRVSRTKKFNRLMHKAGILARTDKQLSRSLKLQLKTVRELVSTKEELWNSNG